MLQRLRALTWKLLPSVFRFGMPWFISVIHPHWHELCISAQTRNSSIVQLDSTPFLPWLGFVCVCLQFALFFVSVASGCAFGLRIRFQFKVTLVLTVDTIVANIIPREAAPRRDLMTSSTSIPLLEVSCGKPTNRTSLVVRSRNDTCRSSSM